MAWITDAVLATACKNANSMASSPLPAQWDAIVPRANRWAYNKVRSTLIGRGYTAAQLDTWDARTDWNERVGILYAFWQASKSDDDRGRAYFDELTEAMKELKSEVITANGVLISNSRIGYGDERTTGDRFTLGEPGDDGEFTVGDGTQL